MWHGARHAYIEFDIPLMVDNPAAHQMGNQEFHRTRRFAERSMTELLECGATITGPNAASYRIYMSLLTAVTPDGKGGSIVSALFSAYARDMASGNSGTRIPCGTTGRFEKQFLDRVTLRAL